MYGDPLPIHLAGNCSSKNVRALLAKCGGVHLIFFFLWGFVHDQVHRSPVRDLADLQERIYAAANNVTPQMLHNTWVEVGHFLLETMLRFMEHEVKKSQFSVFVAIDYIYRFVLVQKL